MIGYVNKTEPSTVKRSAYDNAEDAALARMNAEKLYFSMLEYSPNYSRDAKLLNLLEVQGGPRAPRKHDK